MDPMIRKLVSLREECEKQGIPDFVTSGIDDAMRLFEVSTHWRYRGSDMSAHVLLNLLNELRKRDKMRGLPSILSLFRNEFNKFNNTRARMLDSIYHMTLRTFEISFLV